MSWRIEGGRVLRAAAGSGGALQEGALHLADGRIASAGGARRFDAAGLLVMPGLVDIHGDAQERALQPRPGVDFPPALALADTAAQCLAAGITTAYLGVTLSWEPGLRSRPNFHALLDALASPPPGPELRVHLRFEADNLDALPDALEAIAAGRVHLLGYNDHTPSIARKREKPQEFAKYAARSGLTEAEFHALLDAALARRPEVPAARAQLAAAARAAGIAQLSHDDPSIPVREEFRALGASICEFPLNEEVARHARAAGEAVVMGAPNVVRGGSHLGWASAAPLAEAGVVTVLGSDYHWPALLAAPFRLAARGRMELAAAWALVAENPARALGLDDRGRIAEGLRGDLALVTPGGALVAVFVAGEPAWIAPGAAARIG